MGPGREEYQAAEDGVISRGASWCIAAHGPGDVPQRGVKLGVGRARSDSFVVIHGPTQSDNAVQDTER
jgi:hypothetical protein